MDIRILLFFVIVVLGFFLSIGKDTVIKRQSYIYVIISLLVLESGLRSVFVGADTIFYYSKFLSVNSLSWGDIWDSFRTVYLEGEGKDPGFLVFMKIIYLFTSDFNVFLFICALIFFVPLGLVLKHYSTSILQLMFSFSLYIALFNVVALSGLRQQIATGFCFCAFLLLDKSNYLKALLIILIGSTIHISALVFLLVFPLKLVPVATKTIHALSFFAIPSVMDSSSQIMAWLASFLANDYYSLYAESEFHKGAFVYISLMELLSFFCFIAIKKKIIVKNDKLLLLYIMLPLLTITVPLISLNGAMIRIGQYFTLYMMLLVPIAIDLISKGKERRVLYFGMIVALIFLSLKNSSFEYSFFWQVTDPNG